MNAPKTIEWRIVIGTITFPVSVTTGTEINVATFGKGIPPLKIRNINRDMCRTHILKFIKIKNNLL